MSKKLQHTVTFHCCGANMVKPHLIDHLKAVHGYVDGTAFTRETVLCLDTDRSYSNQYRLLVPCGDKVVEVQQLSEGPRERRF